MFLATTFRLLGSSAHQVSFPVTGISTTVTGCCCDDVRVKSIGILSPGAFFYTGGNVYLSCPLFLLCLYRSSLRRKQIVLSRNPHLESLLLFVLRYELWIYFVPHRLVLAFLEDSFARLGDCFVLRRLIILPY